MFACWAAIKLFRNSYYITEKGTWVGFYTLRTDTLRSYNISREEEELPVLFRKIKLRSPAQKVGFLSLRVIQKLFSFDWQPKESIHTRLQAHDS